MNLPSKAQKDLTAIRAMLLRAVEAEQEESRNIIRQAARKIELLTERVANAPAELGRKGGTSTAERMKAKDPDYYKKLAALRKTKGGGRPKKQPAAE